MLEEQNQGMDIDGRVLVTGGAGFLGSALVTVLLRQGFTVVVLDNFWTSDQSVHHQLWKHPKLTLIRANVADSVPEDILPCARIYHLACPASPKHFATDPLRILDTCYLGTRNVLDKARQWKARLLLASTSEVYGQAERDPQDETYLGNVNCFGPRSCYDEGKRVAEALAYAYRVLYGNVPLTRVARVFNAYGPGMHPDDGRVVTSFIQAAIRGEELVITGDGQSTRCFQYVDDCVTGMIALMESTWEGGPMNIGRETETTIEELAHAVIRSVSKATGGPESGIVYRAAPPDDPVQRRPDCALARRVLGWSAQTDLLEGLQRTIKWHLKEHSESVLNIEPLGNHYNDCENGD
ncbi:UDP-glucuronic acid decarboxylase 1 [Pseudocercospora fuligena]|uniref:UDP-glucuronic acid decarboxylase 1 n=1 Tax=Pseudocercospora fuligena TaxID=685502 RepID=A0A8H6RLT6_9PEZI|nr:UDP-glucuronic acid decarboxylase 1 [Pseudocercospora fuligena]